MDHLTPHSASPFKDYWRAAKPHTCVWIRRGLIATALGCQVSAVGLLSAQTIPGVQRPLGPLKNVVVPGPSDQELSEYVVDKAAAIQLGKALFWDTRVGSDSKTACASCHFHAGADNRITNQINPGILSGDRTFQTGGSAAGPNYTLRPSDFPLTKHSDVNNATTIIMATDVNDVVSSQGVFTTTYDNIKPAGLADDCTNVPDDIFHGGTGFNIGGTNTRRVEPRNTPTVINAVFNFRNFWDGRGNNVFNGGDPFGLRNPNAMVWKFEYGVLRNVAMALPSSSLASQASGPPMSGNEMSCKGRAFVDLGQKLLKQRVLAEQDISPSDSVLGPLAKTTLLYSDLIARAFRPEYWKAPNQIDFGPEHASKAKSMDLFTHPNDQTKIRPAMRKQLMQMEANFALFFGIAVQLYEATLIADDTPFDRFAGGDRTALSDQQITGLKLFQDTAHCASCHSGPEFTGAAFSNVLNQRVERMTMGDTLPGIYDTGFYNIGVRPTAEDLGVGGTDGNGLPLSETRMMKMGFTSLLGNGFNAGSTFPANQRIVADGAFKTPGLRNVEFTGPYFHNGGKGTLMQVVDFYNRGSDFGQKNLDNFDFSIQPLGLNEYEKKALVSFLLALSDDRVRMSRAPFDHPSLCVTNGHPPAAFDRNKPPATAPDLMQCLPAVGAAGTDKPLTRFLDLDPYAH